MDWIMLLLLLLEIWDNRTLRKEIEELENKLFLCEIKPCTCKEEDYE